mmetsp:Transcript_1017/g.1705  ORF Transcript_1017/g.1705 Transcript_1017/m.1705 type:complete len:164 (-) Transcript_1017:1410-1901(-)
MNPNRAQFWRVLQGMIVTTVIAVAAQIKRRELARKDCAIHKSSFNRWHSCFGSALYRSSVASGSPAEVASPSPSAKDTNWGFLGAEQIPMLSLPSWIMLAKNPELALGLLTIPSLGSEVLQFLGLSTQSSFSSFRATRARSYCVFHAKLSGGSWGLGPGLWSS